VFIIAVTDDKQTEFLKNPFSQLINPDGIQIHKDKLHSPDQLAGYDFILVCPNCRTCEGVTWPKRIHHWKQEGKIQGELILATYKGWHWAHLPFYARWITHGGTRTKGRKMHATENSYFIPLPLTVNEKDVSQAHLDNLTMTSKIAFCGGRQDRNFKLANQACKIAKQECYFVSDKLPSEIKGDHKRIPLEEYEKCIRESYFTIVPVVPGDYPHGHSDIARSLVFGKPVLCTKNSGCDKYIKHKINGYLADNTIEDYVNGIKYIQKNITNMVEELRENPYEYQYKHYIRKLHNLCESIYKDKKIS